MTEHDPMDPERSERIARLRVATLQRWLGWVREASPGKNIGKLCGEIAREAGGPLLNGRLNVYGRVVTEELDGCTCGLEFSSHTPECGEELVFYVEDIVEPLRRAGYDVTPPPDPSDETTTWTASTSSQHGEAMARELGLRASVSTAASEDTPEEPSDAPGAAEPQDEGATPRATGGTLGVVSLSDDDELGPDAARSTEEPS